MGGHRESVRVSLRVVAVETVYTELLAEVGLLISIRRIAGGGSNVSRVFPRVKNRLVSTSNSLDFAEIHLTCRESNYYERFRYIVDIPSIGSRGTVRGSDRVVRYSQEVIFPLFDVSTQ